MTLPFLDIASFWTGFIAVGLTALAAIFGLLAWYFSSRAGIIKDERAQKLEEETATAKLEIQRLTS